MARMKVAITGASGLIGSALQRSLREHGHEVVALVRRPVQAGASEIQWDPNGPPHMAVFSGMDAVVHLAGESIAAGRWNATRKSRILNSRVAGTQWVAASIARTNPKPRVLVSSSATGYYGDRGDQVLTESSPLGTGFLAEVGRQWEAAAQPAAAVTRLVWLRTGIVLSREGGALAKMLLPFRLGLGGRIGSGRQWMSWITLDDLVALIEHALARDALRGAVNGVTPNPVTNREFTRTLGRVLHRPTLFSMPAFVARAAFGEMGQELLLAGQRVQPAAALASGFQFRYPDLQPALEHALGRS
jgi:hypothetical protein